MATRKPTTRPVVALIKVDAAIKTYAAGKVFGGFSDKGGCSRKGGCSDKGICLQLIFSTLEPCHFTAAVSRAHKGILECAP